MASGCSCGGDAETGLPKLGGGGPDSLSKRDLIVRLAKAIGNVINAKIETNGRTIDEIISQLKKHIPDPRKPGHGGNGKVIKSTGDGGRHVTLCKKVGEIVNREFGDAINLSASAHEICDQISEVMSALATGLQAEFAGVRADVQRVFKNLEVLKAIHDKAFNKMVGRIRALDKENDTNVEGAIAIALDFHNAVHAEIEHQMGMLRGMLSVVVPGSPSDKEIEAALKHSRELKEFARRIKDTAPGQASFGEKLSYMMSGAVSTASAIAAVDKAMSVLGIKREELEKASTSQGLRDLTADKMQAAIKSGHVDSNKINQFLKAAGVLENHLYLLKSFQPASMKYARPVDGGSDATGGDQKIDKRIKERKLARKGLLRMFNARMAQLWVNMVKSAGDVGKAISTGRVKLSDKLENFNSALSLIDSLDPSMYYALSGYFNDAEARQKRESFLGKLDYVLHAIDALAKESGSVDGLSGMKSALNDIMKLVSEYNKEYETGFEGVIPPKKSKGSDLALGADDAVVESDLGDNLAAGGLQGVPSSLSSAASTAGQTAGQIAAETAAAAGKSAACAGLKIASESLKCGGDDERLLAGELPQLTTVADNLRRTQVLINYAIRTSQIRHNMKIASEEVKHYSEGYVKVLADAIAGAIDNEANAYDKYRVENNKNAPGGHGLYADLLAAYNTRTGERKPEMPTGCPEDSTYQAIMGAKKQQMDARVAMYRTAEAVDLYMLEFTEAMNADPDAIRSVIQTVGDNSMIVSWFSQVSGDRICNVFDLMPSSIDAAGVVKSTSLKLESTPTNHYYTRVSTILAAAAPAANTLQENLPGNPFLARPIYSVPAAGGTGVNNWNTSLEAVADALKITAFKNMIAAFFNIADMFGGKRVSETIPMTPVEIYKNLSAYMQFSSFAIGHAKTVDTTAVGTPMRTNYATADYTAPGSGAGTYATGNSVSVGFAENTPIDAHNAYIMRSVAAPIMPPYAEAFADTDHLFCMVIKAIVAKIFVALGVHDVLNRPINDSGLGYFDGLRLVVGGDLAPKVIPEALELYIRLPLLAEFYRKIFDFDNIGADAAESITMIPEVDGTFSRLIMFMFDRNKYVDDGNYSETDISNLIMEINQIYERFAKSANPVMSAIEAFINEINLRYGVVSKSDRDAFIKERNERWRAGASAKTVDTDTATDFELEGFDETEIYNRPMPSRSYETAYAKLTAMGEGKHKHELKLGDLTYKRMIHKLKNKMQAMFKHTEDKIFADTNNDFEHDDPAGRQDILGKVVTFRHMLKARGEELAYAKHDGEKYTIVLTAMQSLGKYNMSALEKSYLLFHEVIVAPLNALMGVYLEVAAYRGQIQDMAAAVSAIDGKVIGAGIRTFAQLVDLNVGVVGPDDVYRKTLKRYVSLRDSHRESMPDDIALTDAFHTRNQGGATDMDIAGLIAAANNLTADEQIIAIRRYGVRQGRMFRHLIDTLYAHTANCDKYVTMRVDVLARDDRACNISISMDHSKLIERVQETISTVKKSIEKFRGLLPNKLIEKYEDAGSQGSIYWLEQELLDTIIRGHKVGGEKDTLDAMNRQIGKIVEYLTRKWTVGFDDAGTRIVTKSPSQQHSFFTPMLAMIANSAGAQARPLANTGGSMFIPLYNQMSKNVGTTAPGAPWDTTIAAQAGAGQQIYTTYTDGAAVSMKAGAQRSVMVQFNKLLANYINCAFDAPSRKILLTAINDFATGNFGVSVMAEGDAYRLDDSVAASFGRAAVMKGEPLVRSLAELLKHLMNDRGADTRDPLYIDDDVANIQVYVKERYRSEFPIFEHMFNDLIARCDLLKVISRGFYMARYDRPVAGTAATVDMQTAHNSFPVFLDKIIAGASSLNSCIGKALKLIGDEPKYMELSQNFLRDYKALNGYDAFTPLSISSFALRKRLVDPTGDYVPITPQSPAFYSYLPGETFGNAKQKLHYGVRQAFMRDADTLRIVEFPGMVDIAKAHNHSSDKRFQFSEAELMDIIKQTISLTQYYIGADEYRDWSSLVATTVSFEHPTNYNTALDWGGANSLWGYYLQQSRTVEDLVRSVESNNQKDYKRSIVSLLEDKKDCNFLGDRDDMIIYNIIDMNKQPINLHALMRDIPLTPTYLYADTFNVVVEKLLGSPVVAYWKKASPAFPGLSMSDVPTGKDIFAQLLMHPRAPVDDDVYHERVSQIMRGDLSIQGLAQPRMLGAEFYNKALFGELYPGEVYSQAETSPALGHAHLRGKQEVLADLHHFTRVLKQAAMKMCYKIFEANNAIFGTVLINEEQSDRLFNLVATYKNINEMNDPKLIDVIVSGPLFATELPAAAAANGKTIHFAEVIDAVKSARARGTPINVVAGVAIPGSSVIATPDDVGVVDIITGIIDSISQIYLFIIAVYKFLIIKSMPGASVKDISTIALTYIADVIAAQSVGQPFDTTTVAPPPILTGIKYGPVFARMRVDQVLLNAKINAADVKSLTQSIPDSIPWSSTSVNARANIVQSNPRYFPSQLHYMAADPKKKGTMTKLEKVNVGTHKDILQVLGKMRFDTVFSRWIMWMANIQRLILMYLRRGYTWSNSRVVSGQAMLAPGNTELFGQDMAFSRERLPGGYRY